MDSPDDWTSHLDDARTKASRFWRRRVLAHRRLLAGVFAGLAVLLLVQALRPGPTTVAADVPAPVDVAGAHPDLVVLPLRLPDAGMASLLRAGDHIDLMATDPQTGGTRVVAHGALVVEVPELAADTGVTTGSGGRLVVVGVVASSVDDVTSASVRDFLTYAYAH